MYLIIASQVDENARDLFSYFPDGTTRILTPADLSQPGWSIYTSKPENSVFVIGGESFRSREIDGILCLLPYVFSSELVQINREDRDYVASEMTAFLKYWLSSLSCPILNEPTAGCISGPNWRREQWTCAAVNAGIRVSLLKRSTGIHLSPDNNGLQMETVTLIGDKELNEQDSGLSDHVRKLAKIAGVSLLSATFMKSLDDENYKFWDANTFPILQGSRAVQLIMDYFNRS